MGQLREVVQIIKNECERTRKRPKDRISKKVLKKIVKKYDIDSLEERARVASDANLELLYPKKRDSELRKKHPGKFDVVFINNHTKEKQILTRKEGVTYDLAYAYYNYNTFFGSEKHNEFGYYDIVEHEEPFLPEENHFGI